MRFLKKLPYLFEPLHCFPHFLHTEALSWVRLGNPIRGQDILFSPPLILQLREKTSKNTEMCSLFCLVPDSQHVVSLAKHRHLLTYSVQLSHEAQLSISETMVTNNLRLAE